MVTLARTPLVSLVALGFAQVPCYAQHMNAAGAPCQQPAFKCRDNSVLSRGVEEGGRRLKPNTLTNPKYSLR